MWAIAAGRPFFAVLSILPRWEVAFGAMLVATAHRLGPLL